MRTTLLGSRAGQIKVTNKKFVSEKRQTVSPQTCRDVPKTRVLAFAQPTDPATCAKREKGVLKADDFGTRRSMTQSKQDVI
jgi:hypothetical protein